MHTFSWTKIGLFLAPDDAYASYYREALEHAGVRFETIDEISNFSHYGTVILAGKGEIDYGKVGELASWVQEGGTLLVSGSAWGLEELIGVVGAPRHVSNATVKNLKPGDRLWPEFAEKFRFFGADVYKTSGCETVCALDGASILWRRRVGKGLIIGIAIHLGQSLSLMLGGKGVEVDGVGPSDPYTRLDDGILRAEEATNLDFEHDRTTIEGSPAPFFGAAHADILSEILVRSVIECVEHSGGRVVMTWFWPRQAPAAALLTLDTENPEFDHALHLHRILAMFGCPAAWMVAMPGYSIDSYRSLRAWDHEVGLLFQTDNGPGWHEERMKIQFSAMGRLASVPMMTSARPVDGRWKGWNNFYDLCQTSGARVSLSKGGRQPGTSGFLFGTCHPFFPRKRDGSPYYVLEIPYAMFEPGATTPDAVSDFLIAQTASRHGCMQIVFRPESIHVPDASNGLRRALSICKQARLEFMLPEQIFKFEKARRSLRISSKLLGDEGLLGVSSDVAVEGMSMMVSGSSFTATAKNRHFTVTPVKRFGTVFNIFDLDLEEKVQVEVSMQASIDQAA